MAWTNARSGATTMSIIGLYRTNCIRRLMCPRSFSLGSSRSFSSRTTGASLLSLVPLLFKIPKVGRFLARFLNWYHMSFTPPSSHSEVLNGMLIAPIKSMQKGGMRLRMWADGEVTIRADFVPVPHLDWNNPLRRGDITSEWLIFQLRPICMQNSRENEWSTYNTKVSFHMGLTVFIIVCVFTSSSLKAILQ